MAGLHLDLQRTVSEDRWQISDPRVRQKLPLCLARQLRSGARGWRSFLRSLRPGRRIIVNATPDKAQEGVLRHSRSPLTGYWVALSISPPRDRAGLSPRIIRSALSTRVTAAVPEERCPKGRITFNLRPSALDQAVPPPPARKNRTCLHKLSALMS